MEWLTTSSPVPYHKALAFMEKRVSEIKSGWAYGKAIEGQYSGWVKANTLGCSQKSTHIIKAIRSFVYKKPENHPGNYVTVCSMILNA